MMDEKDRVFDHDYDGIREYDNPLPPWWLNLFYITIAWAVIYLLYYHVFEVGDRSRDELMREYDPMWTKEKDPDYTRSSLFTFGYRAPYSSTRSDRTPRMMAERAGVVVKKTEEVEEVYDFTALDDRPSLEMGRAVYVKNCVPCHGQGGEGGIGPNLTDDYWIHGSDINGIMKTIVKGVPEKGMIAWGKVLKKEELLPVGSYIVTLKGTNPPNPKAPQGTLVQK